MNILEVKDLCKTYGTGETEVHALNHISFSVRKGEFIAIVGESGSGKSTLLNVVGALDNATSGKVLIDGKDIFSMSEKKLTVFRRQHIGFIFQSFNLIPELNVEQNITFPLLLDYKKLNPKFVNELLNVLGLAERRNHLPSQLSGGQQQRVAIGRALVTAAVGNARFNRERNAVAHIVASALRLSAYCRCLSRNRQFSCNEIIRNTNLI